MDSVFAAETKRLYQSSRVPKGPWQVRERGIEGFEVFSLLTGAVVAVCASEVVANTIAGLPDLVDPDLDGYVRPFGGSPMAKALERVAETLGAQVSR